MKLDKALSFCDSRVIAAKLPPIYQSSRDAEIQALTLPGSFEQSAGGEILFRRFFLRTGLFVTIAVSAGTFACILALPAHSLHAHEVDATK